MTSTLILIAAIVALGLLYVVMPSMLGAYRRYRGQRLVTCPETREAAAVDVDIPHAVLSTTVGPVDLRLTDCSRWPERHDCGQPCLRQIEAAPSDCLVRTILAGWYRGKSCVFCRKAVGAIESWGHQAALLGLDGATVEWGEVNAEALPHVLKSHYPVCWSCHVVRSLRRQHPELVSDRYEPDPGRSGRPHY